MKRTAVFYIFVLLATQVFAGDLGIGPQIGYHKAKDANKGKMMYGGALRLKLSPALGVEGSINYRKENYENGNLIIKSWPVFVTGLLYPIPALYGAAGAGWYYTTYDYQNLAGTTPINDETSREVGWHFGGGVELPVGSSTKLAADIRYVFIDYKFKEIPGSKDLKSDFFMIEVGLFFGL